MDPIIKKCGNCAFAQPTADAKFIECYGNPPTTFITGVQQDALGRPSYNIELLSPRLSRDRSPCALHKPKFEVMDLSGLANRETVGNS